MRRPATTLSPVEEMSGEPKLPRQTSRFQGAAGGKPGGSTDDFAGDTQVKAPHNTKAFMTHGHEKTPIASEHIFGQRNQGDRNANGYKMHLNPNDMARAQSLQADTKNVAAVNIPKQPRKATKA